MIFICLGQYEICANPEKVDLLVSLTYIAANALGLDPRPTGLGLRVPTVSASTGMYTTADYDQLAWPAVRLPCIYALINVRLSL